MLILCATTGRRGKGVPKGNDAYSRRVGACLPPKSGDATGGRKARRYAELENGDLIWCRSNLVRGRCGHVPGTGFLARPEFGNATRRRTW